MTLAAQLRDEGKTAAEAVEWLNENKTRVQHWFFPGDLSFYYRGGRVAKTQDTTPESEQVYPLLSMTDEGKMTFGEKFTGKENSFKGMVAKMQECAKDHEKYSGTCYIAHSNCYEDALHLQKLVEETMTEQKGKIQINSIGTTIGAHTGPGTVALFYFGEKR
ncbi:MAG: DegV family protein [Lachnospiraceae bacterium]